MNKKLTLVFISLFIILSLSFGKELTLKERAIKIVRNSIVVDTHEDTPTTIYKGVDISIRRDKGNVDFPRLIEGGLNSPVFAVWISNKKDENNPEVYALKVISLTLKVIKENNKIAEIAYSAEDIKKITRKGKIAITLSFENSSPMHNPEYVDIFYKTGIRMASLTHMSTNYLSDSSTDKEKWGGISPMGEKIIERMNELGMIIDVSHLSDKAVEDILKISKAPIIASHSCVRALAKDVKRNLPDNLIKRIAKSGGLIDVNFASFYLDGTLGKKYREIRNRYKEKIGELEKKYPSKGEEFEKELKIIKNNRKSEYENIKPDLSIVIKHIKYIKDLVGIEHVGLGTDFEGIGDASPIGLEDATKIPALVEEMLKQGFTEEEIKKFLGMNFIRFYKQVERIKTVNL
jgi:membrane dipeptidase